MHPDHYKLQPYIRLVSFILFSATLAWLYYSWGTDRLTLFEWYLSLVYWTGMTVLGLFYYSVFKVIGKIQTYQVPKRLRMVAVYIQALPFFYLLFHTSSTVGIWLSTLDQHTLAIILMYLSCVILWGKFIWCIMMPKDARVNEGDSA